jgi:hypothetical protein
MLRIIYGGGARGAAVSLSIVCVLATTFTATVADDETTTRTGAFNVGSGTAGNLKASQTWGSTQTVTYEAIGEAGYTLCGDTGKWFTSVTKTRQA